MTSVQDALVSALGTHRGAAAADRLCAICVELFSVDAVSISLVFDGTTSGTLGASGPEARAFDELQFTLGEGPCLDAVAGREPVFVHDLERLGDTRWPAYRVAMLGRGIHGVFGLPVLVAGAYLGALDLFRQLPGPLVAGDLTGALMAAELAELPVLDLLDSDLAAAVTDPDSDGWTELTSLTRTEVAQATGMLVAQLELSPTAALVRLRAYAFSVGRSATEVARDILDHGLRLEAD